jgi:hypothetical protein
MDILHIKKNNFDKHENVVLLLVPLVVFLVTLATLLAIFNSPLFRQRSSVAGQKTQVLDQK